MKLFKILLPVLFLQVFYSTAQEVDAYGCMGMLTYVGEQCEDVLPAKDLDEVLTETKKTYSLYNAQCREVIYTNFSEERVNEALALANECTNTLEEYKRDLSKEYDGYACMGIIDKMIARCDPAMPVSEITALKFEADRIFEIYNQRCVYKDEPVATFGNRKKVNAKIMSMDDCYVSLYKKAGIRID